MVDPKIVHPWQSEMIDALTVMRQAGLADFGRFPKDADELMATATTYCIAIQDRGGLQAFIGPAARIAIRSSGEFPSAPAFAGYVLEAIAASTREVPLTLIDPLGREVVMIVKVPATDTQQQVAARLRAVGREQARLGYRPVPPALPSPPATREQLLELRQRLSGQNRLAKDIDNHPSL